jgi:integrase
MGKVGLLYVEERKDRRGRVAYWYFVRRGIVFGALPGAPGSEEFAAAYHRLLTETAPKPPDSAAAGQTLTDPRDYPRGTFGALVTDFLGSAQFKTKSDRTRGEYQRIAELLQEEHGWKRVAKIRRRHIRKMRDAKSDTPGAANNVLRILKILLNFAVDDELIESSPAAKFKELPVGEWRAWTDEECVKFEKKWAPGTMQRRAYAVALYTGQRKQDQITRTRSHRWDGGIHVVQSKTDQELWIPEHPELTAELGRGVAGTDTLLFTPTQGKPFDSSYYGSWFAEAIDDAGLPDDCVLHGLRKTAARTLAELGLSEADIQSITGHVTARMVSKYVKSADQKKRARRAMKAWGNSR